MSSISTATGRNKLSKQELQAEEAKRTAERRAAEAAVNVHSRDKVKLCEHIILDHFGPVASRIASVLLQRGRMSIRDLNHFMTASADAAAGGSAPAIAIAQQASANGAKTGTSTTAGPSALVPSTSRRLVQQTLLVLIQQNVAYHARLNPNGAALAEKEEGGTEYFECNPEAILPRVRFGRYIGLAEKMWGDEGAAIVTEILKHGKVRASDIIKRLGGGDANMEHKISSRLAEMLYKYYLQPSVVTQHVSPRDAEISMEEARKKDRKSILTPKEIKELKAEVAATLQTQKEMEWIGTQEINGPANRRGLRPRRKINGDDGGSKKKRKTATKKQKLSNGKASASGLLSLFDDDEDMTTQDLEIIPETFLRVHYDRFDVHMRDELILTAAESMFNRPVAQVLKAINMLAEAARDKVSPADDRSEAVALTALANALPKQVSLKSALDRKSVRRGRGSDAPDPSRFELIAEVVGILARVDDTSGFGENLRFLSPPSQGNSTTLSAGGSRVPQSFHVQYNNICGGIKRQVLRQVVESQFGSNAARVMWLLMDKGKLDEKQIAKVVLLSMGETRDICGGLFQASLLSLQEVPKTSDRNPMRTYFLWYVDEEKSKAWLLDHLYKMQTRLGQRRREEMRRQESLLSKAERLDVKLDPTLLAERELEQLERLKTTREMLALAELRCDMDAFTISHLPG